MVGEGVMAGPCGDTTSLVTTRHMAHRRVVTQVVPLELLFFESQNIYNKNNHIIIVMLVINPNKCDVTPFTIIHVNINNCEKYCVPNITLFMIAMFHLV